MSAHCTVCIELNTRDGFDGLFHAALVVPPRDSGPRGNFVVAMTLHADPVAHTTRTAVTVITQSPSPVLAIEALLTDVEQKRAYLAPVSPLLSVSEAAVHLNASRQAGLSHGARRPADDTRSSPTSPRARRAKRLAK